MIDEKSEKVTQRLIEKLKEIKDASGMTNQQVADQSGVPFGTVNRILAGQTDNPSFANIAAMVKAMGGSLDELVGIVPKAKTTEEHISHRLLNLYEAQLGTKDKWIRTLFLALVIMVGVLAFLLLWDVTHPDMGYVRY